MKKIFMALSFVAALLAILSTTSCKKQAVESNDEDVVNLKNAFNGKFLIGAALNTPQCNGEDSVSRAVVVREFNSIVAENCMKSEVIQPQQGIFDFELADQFVEFGTANNLFIIGHTLVWHSQTPDWIFVDKDGNDVSRDTLIQRMKDHIYTVVGRYKGRVHGWDVVNEAIIDDAGLRKSKWYTIIGSDYIELAFKFAQEADPEAELYYNDYNLYKEHKRNETIQLVKNLQAKGCRVDGVGMQAHYGINMDVFSGIDSSIIAFSDLGVNVMITELDVSVLPFPTEQITAEVSQSYANKPEFNPYTIAIPDSIQNQLTEQYKGLFEVYLKHSDKISRITFWGVNDHQSWRNYWPIHGRTDYPLFFDRNNEAKPVVGAVINMTKK